MKIFNRFRASVLATLAGLAVFGAALAVDYGWNPSTGLEAFHGALISQGTLPTITGSAGCGTLTAKVGGPSAGSVTIGTFSSSCVLTLTFPSASPNGWFCRWNDLTTAAGLMIQASTTTTTCVSNASAVVVTGDTIVWSAMGF